MGKLVVGENDLLTWCKNNGEWGKQLMEEWVGQFEDGTPVRMDEISRSHSRHRVYWRCHKCSHVWTAKIHNRTANKSGCPECVDMSVAVRNGKIKPGINDLYTWCKCNGSGNILIEEWTGLTVGGEKVNIDAIAFSSRLEVLWKCSICGQLYPKKILNRTQYGTGCSECTSASTSYPEQLIFIALSSIYSNCKNRYKGFGGFEYDIALIDNDIYIEYSPSITHKGKEDRDNDKKLACIESGAKFIYITEQYIADGKVEISINDSGIDMITKLLGLLGHSIDEININDVMAKAYRRCHGERDFEEKLKTVFPNLASEWNPNNTVDIDRVKFNYDPKVMWICSACGYGKDGEWSARIPDRIRDKSGCPRCGWNWFKHEYVVNKSSVVFQGVNDLASVYPTLAAEWHKDNISKPNEVRCNHYSYVKWNCQNCGYGHDGRWIARVSTRASGKTGCPNCGYNWYKAQTGQHQSLKKKRKVQEQIDW